MVRRCLALLLFAMLGLSAAPAAANGRFPAAQRLLRSPANPDELYLSATFGLLASGDRGQNWYYVCERAFASAVVEGDALLEVLPTGEVLSGIFESLGASSDCACTFPTIAAAPPAETIADLTRTAEGALLALLRTSEPGSTPRFRLDRSEDAGRTWTALSELPSTIGEALTLDAAPSEPSRVYASALTVDGAASLLVSDDGGRSWEERPLAPASAAEQPYIAAVDPNDSDALYVRTDSWQENEEGLEQANDALHFSGDAGRSWSELIRRAGKLFGFALGDAGRSVFVGYGDPVQAVRVTRSEELGVYRARAGEFAFTQVVAAPVSCLGWNAGELDVCFAENHPELQVDFSVGRVNAESLVGATPLAAFTPILRLADVRGPLACVAELCNDDWTTGNELAPAACSRLRADCAPDTSGHVFECSARGAAGRGGGSAGGGAGAGAGAGAGGNTTGGVVSVAGASSAAGSTGGVGLAGNRGDEGSDGGCACRASRAGFSGAKILLTFALFTAFALRRRRILKP